MSSTPARKSYPSDLTDAQWTILEPLIPAAKHGGRPRKLDMREILNAIFYINRSGCQWDMLPHDLPPKSSVYVYFARWRDDGTWQTLVDALRMKVRTEVEGREATPSAGSIDSQSVKSAGQPAGNKYGVRRGQEDHRPQASFGGGYAGFVAGGRGDQRGDRRRHGCPCGARAAQRPEVSEAEGDLDGQQVSQP